MRVRGMLSLLAMCTIVGFAASEAQASGPVWWEAGSKELANTSVEVIGNLTNFKIRIFTYTLVCTRVSNVAGSESPGSLFTGNPGSGVAEMEYSGCSVASLPNCIVKPIKTTALMLLTYPEKGANGTSALDAFFPFSGSTFATFTLENKSSTETCSLEGAKVELEATGTEIEIPKIDTKRKCGVLAKMGRVAEGSYKETKPGEIEAKGAVRFPESVVEEAEWWNPAAAPEAKFEKLKCILQAKVKFSPGGGYLLLAAQEIGDVSITIKGEKEFGWNV